jgi:Zinc-binding loop region of homing endonuclease
MESFFHGLHVILEKKSIQNTDGKGCIHWTGAVDSSGYGKKRLVWPDGKISYVGAHRLAYMVKYHLTYATIPKKGVGVEILNVSHLCHNRLCINTDHLTLETHSVNQSREHCKMQGQCTKLHMPHCLNL